MKRFKSALILLTVALSVMLIALSGTYMKTRCKMQGVSHIKSTAYKVVNEWQ